MISKVAQYVVSLAIDGRVISQGTLAEALSHNSKLLAEVAKETELEEKKASVIDPPEEGEKPLKKEGKLVVAEEVALGRVSWPARKWIFARAIITALKPPFKLNCTCSRWEVGSSGYANFKYLLVIVIV